MRLILAMAVAMAFVFGGAEVSQAAARKTKPEVRLDDDGQWMVMVKIHYLDGTWNYGWWMWSGVQSQINWASAVLVAFQGNGGGLQPEARWMLVGSRIEIIDTPIRYVP